MSILITKNTLHQLNLEGKKRNLAFLGNKNFKDKNGNRPLDGEALYSQQKQDRELTVAQIMNSLLPNADLY